MLGSQGVPGFAERVWFGLTLCLGDGFVHSGLGAFCEVGHLIPGHPAPIEDLLAGDKNAVPTVGSVELFLGDVAEVIVLAVAGESEKFPDHHLRPLSLAGSLDGSTECGETGFEISSVDGDTLDPIANGSIDEIIAGELPAGRSRVGILIVGYRHDEGKFLHRRLVQCLMESPGRGAAIADGHAADHAGLAPEALRHQHAIDHRCHGAEVADHGEEPLLGTSSVDVAIATSHGPFHRSQEGPGRVHQGLSKSETGGLIPNEAGKNVAFLVVEVVAQSDAEGFLPPADVDPADDFSGSVESGKFVLQGSCQQHPAERVEEGILRALGGRLVAVRDGWGRLRHRWQLAANERGNQRKIPDGRPPRLAGGRDPALRSSMAFRYLLEASETADGLSLTRDEDPEFRPLSAGEIRVKINACSLNYRDLLMRQGQSASSAGGGVVPLSDGAGVVEEIGEGVTRWRVGDRVTGTFFPEWETGRFSMRFHQAARGGSCDGVLASHVVGAEGGFVLTPEYLSDAEAACLPCAALTAWHALFERGGLVEGETVLALGTGGVSIFALQLAAAAGARVIVTSSSDQKLERARMLGASETINYRETEDWDARAWELTDKQGVDHVIEVGGPGTLGRSMNAVAPGGHIALIGVLTGFEAPGDSLFPLVARNVDLHGIYVGSREMFERMNAFLELHQLRPVIDQRFSFAEVVAAYDHLASGSHFGKVVIEG